MIDIKILRKDPEIIKKNLNDRGISIDLNTLTMLDKKTLEKIRTNEKKQNERNTASAEIAKKKVSGNEKEKLIIKTRQLGQEIKENNEEIRDLEKKRNNLLSSIPNFLLKEVPYGKDESTNQEVRKIGEIPKFSFKVQNHYELGEKLDILDIARGVKVAQSRFAILKGKGAMLERALAQFMLDIHLEEHYYQEYQPPILVNPSALFGTGQLPKFEEDLFLTKDGLFLIPTAEVPLTNIYKDEIIPEKKLPLQFVAHTPCFRSEAGSYGKDTKGLIRQHQFFKVELVWITHPEESERITPKISQTRRNNFRKIRTTFSHYAPL